MASAGQVKEEGLTVEQVPFICTYQYKTVKKSSLVE